MVNMSTEDLQKKYNGNLNSEMTGPLHNLIAKVRTATNHLSCGCVKFHIYFTLEIRAVVLALRTRDITMLQRSTIVGRWFRQSVHGTN